MTLDETIEYHETIAKEHELLANKYEMSDENRKSCLESAAAARQYAEWLKELQRYRFEISECKAILDNPTPDVTENDRKRAMYVLQTFPDVRGDER
jgi:hypothetical protein